MVSTKFEKIQIDLSEYKNMHLLKEVTSDKHFKSSKNDIFHPEGLYSEQIFGPIKSYSCQCKKVFGKINDGKICDKCGVKCCNNEIRSSTFAKIVLPENIYIINPITISVLKQLFGPYAIKKILDKKYLNDNRNDPYFYSYDKSKLLKKNKIGKNEKYLDFEIFDIMTLKEGFDILMEDEKINEKFKKTVIQPDLLNYIFMNEVLVIPPSSRTVIKMNGKTLIDELTKLYTTLIVNKKSISDALFIENSTYFGYTIYKYQEKISEIYEKIRISNFDDKKSYIRESLTGKTVEFSQRAIIIPNPALKPYQIGLHKESVKKLFMPELLRYLLLKMKDDNIISAMDKIRTLIGSDIDIDDEEFIDFIKQFGEEFRIIIEREPVLWKYNTVGSLLGRVYNDDDLFLGETINEGE